MGVKYTEEELKDASKKVMKSLNRTTTKGNKLLSKSALNNSGKISKSSRKRLNKKQRSNLAGKSMESLLDLIPQVEEPVYVPPKQAEIMRASNKVQLNRKAEKKIVQHEIQQFMRPKTLDEIKQNIQKMRENQKQ